MLPLLRVLPAATEQAFCQDRGGHTRLSHQEWIAELSLLVQICCTGHSLGGALATLAAFDISRAMEWVNRPTKIICYTFGAPRVGNYAFAETYNKLVPETWNVVNDQVQVKHPPTISKSASSCAHYLPIP